MSEIKDLPEGSGDGLEKNKIDKNELDEEALDKVSGGRMTSKTIKGTMGGATAITYTPVDGDEIDSQ